MSEGDRQELARREEIRDYVLEDIEIFPVSQGCSKEVDRDKNAAEITELADDVRRSIERDFEFLKRVTNVDREILYSLLLSQVNNSRRLDTIMGDILGIPQEAMTINYFGEDNQNREIEQIEIGGCSAKFLIQIREMFPDADVTFLSEECRSLDTEEEFTRFVNTVMLSGLYPKKSPNENDHQSSDSIADGNKFVDDSSAKPVVYSSDEEISSSGIIESSSHCHRKRRRTRSSDRQTCVAGPSTSAIPEEPEIVFINALKYFPEYPDSYYEYTERQRLCEEAHNLRFNAPSKSNTCQVPAKDDSVNDSSKITMDWDVIKICSNLDEGIGDESPSTSSKKSKSNKLTKNQQKSSNFEEDDVNVTTTSTDSAEVGEAEQDEDLSEDWVNEQTAELIRLFPNTDPSFLREECVKFNGSLEAMNEFVIANLENNNMPTRADYEKRLELVELQNRYTNNFSIEDFLKVIPDPWTYFSNSERNCAKYKLHSVIFLKTAFRKVYSRVITDTLIKNNFNLYLSYKELKEKNPNGRIRGRSDAECMRRPATIDIQFLQEAAFIRNERKIRDFIQTREDGKKLRFEEAKRTGNLIECQCCFDSEILVEDIVYCPKNHAACKYCVIKYVEVEMGQAKCQFSCLAECDEKYTLTALQNVVKPELFSKIIQANQMEEIQSAGIEDLVQCPFCNYATIMPPEVKILPCLNPECQKESCRICKELSHIPLRCDEVEKSEEVRMRTYIENKMTEALVRKCYKCGKAFVKEGGCNKMVCSCGAGMCYVCRKPVRDYSHFNGQGGTEYEKCPLYSTNDELHIDIVQRVAEQAKAEILEANPNKTLKHDPTKVLPKRTYDPPLVGMNPGAALAVGLLALEDLQYHFNRRELFPYAVNNNLAGGNQEQHGRPLPYRAGNQVNHNNLRNRNRAGAVIQGRRGRNIQNRVNQAN